MDNRDYVQDQQSIQQFLEEFYIINEQGERVLKYPPLIEKIANREKILLVIELGDLMKFNQGLYDALMSNTDRYEQLFKLALDELLPKYKTRDPTTKDILDVFIEQRRTIAEMNANRANNQQTSQSKENTYPPDLLRRFEVSFKPSNFDTIPIRDVKAEYVGKLVTVRGIVIRTSDVKPKITVACYTCDQCGYEIFQPIKGLEFNPLFQCDSAPCQANKSLGRLTKQFRGSVFTSMQEIKLQEHSDHVPTGHIPRTITIHAFGELTRLCNPGDHVSVSGIYDTIEKTGYRMRTGGLSADTYVHAHYITRISKTEDNELNVEPMSAEEANVFTQQRQNFLHRLSQSIAPEIYGHDELKKALLLLLVGGVDKNPNGMRIRGNINICLMGDPGTAKSQMLNFIDRLATRSQFTTGRGSSGIGLTAAVMKDPITGEMTLEGGALVLADQGICCIDEFDKMMDADRTAIHEVMEQQTVSIAKAGIFTTLNARVSILAAANPAYGRYNKHRTIEENLQLPAALLSRFDLLWLITDRPDKNKDLDLAQHITSVHTNPEQVQNFSDDVIDMKVIRRYIELCKTKNPVIPTDLDEKLVKIYLGIRERKRFISDDDEALFTSPRSLLAIMRLSTAFARLRLADKVELGDIEQAMHLFECSRESVEKTKTGNNTTHIILSLIRAGSKGGESMSMQDLMDQTSERGMNADEVRKALDNLQSTDTIFIDQDGDEVVLVG